MDGNGHPVAMPVAQREHAPLPEKPAVPYRDYAIAREAHGRSSELLLQLSTRLAMYEPGTSLLGAAAAHRKYLRSLAP